LIKVFSINFLLLAKGIVLSEESSDLVYDDKLKVLLLEISKKNTELTKYTDMLNKVAIVSKADTKGYITYVNDIFCTVSGYSRDELIGKNHNIIRHPNMSQDIFHELWETIRSGHVWSGSIKNLSKSGEVYFVYATIFPLYDENNENILEYIGIRFLTTKEENEKREFHKNVIHSYQEFRKSSYEDHKKIEELSKEIELFHNKTALYNETIENLKSKNQALVRQIDFSEESLVKMKISHQKYLDNNSGNTQTISELYKKATQTIESQKKELNFTKENTDLRKKEIISLETNLIKQRETIKELREIIKQSKNEEKDKEESKPFWNR